MAVSPSKRAGITGMIIVTPNMTKKTVRNIISSSGTDLEFSEFDIHSIWSQYTVYQPKTVLFALIPRNWERGAIPSEGL